MTSSSNIKRTTNHKKALIISLCVLIVIGLGLFIYLRHHNSYNKVATNKGVATADTNVPKGNNTSESNTATSTKGDGSQPSSASNDSSVSSVMPVKPSGEFVSDHSPNLSGSPHPSNETSVCDTTPDVDCQIQFISTSTGSVKSLPIQTTDSSGFTTWTNWNIQSIGLTAGDWKVSAVAKSGNNETTTKDSTIMVVEQ